MAERPPQYPQTARTQLEFQGLDRRIQGEATVADGERVSQPRQAVKIVNWWGRWQEFVAWPEEDGYWCLSSRKRRGRLRPAPPRIL